MRKVCLERLKLSKILWHIWNNYNSGEKSEPTIKIKNSCNPGESSKVFKKLADTPYSVIIIKNMV